MDSKRIDIRRVVAAALAEDAAKTDITTQAFIGDKCRVRARIFSREKGIVCGVDLAKEVFAQFDPLLRVSAGLRDGQLIKPNDTIMTLRGSARSVLSCERVALNFLTYLSGISTQTHKACQAVKHAGIRILDTRKTTPLMRSLEKYAVSVGGGRNHRFNLADQYLVKDNHLFVLQRTASMHNLSRRNYRIPFEIEVENFEELSEMLGFFPDIVMLDNFSPPDVRRAIGVVARVFPNRRKRPLIELSGGITPENIRRYAIRGVDFISLGALTHSAPALDMSLEILECR